MKCTVLALTELAVMMGEPSDQNGDRWLLMAQSLADLPLVSILYAVKAWERGESRHLSAYQQDHTRIGVFFPKPAELREIARMHIREQGAAERDRRERAEWDFLKADIEAHPERYCSMADIARDVLARRDAKRTAEMSSQ